MIKLIDYIKDCLKDREFRNIWEEENSDLDPYIFGKNLTNESFNGLTIQEALKLLNEMDDENLNSIVDNKGVYRQFNDFITTEVIFYEEKNNCPVEEFLTNISNKKLKSKTLRNIMELAIKGSDAKPHLPSYVDDGIFELRTKQSSNINRIFYFFIFGNKIIMTNGYIKKSQKLNAQEFEKAKRYRDNYMRKFK